MRRAKKGSVPRILYVVCSTASNPHADSELQVFTRKRRAQRAFRWSDQRIVEFVPRGRVAE